MTASKNASSTSLQSEKQYDWSLSTKNYKISTSSWQCGNSALFQTYEKIIKWCNKKTANTRKFIHMKVRDGRKTFNNNSSTCEIEIPNKTSKKNKTKRSKRIVRLIKKKANKNDVLNNLPSSKKYHSECKTSSSNCGNSFTENMKSRPLVLPITSFPNQTVISHLSEDTPVTTSLNSASYEGQNLPSSTLHLPVTLTPSHSVVSDVCEVKNLSSTFSVLSVISTPGHSVISNLKELPSTSSHLPMTSTQSHSVISGSLKVSVQPSTSSHFFVTSVPNKEANQFSGIGTKNFNSINQNTFNTVNTNISCKNYHSPISDTGATMSKNLSLQNNKPLVVDVTDTTRNKSKRKKCSVLESIISQEPESSKQDEVRKIGNQKRKHNVSVKAVLSSEVKCTGEQTEKNDVCSVISVPSDDEIVVIENEKTPALQLKEQNANSNLPPSKRQKTSSEVPIIDLCTPEHSSSQSRMKSRENNNLLVCAMKNIKRRNRKSDLKKSCSKNHMSSQNQVPSLSQSRKSLKNYMSILGILSQRGPFPSSSSTVTSSATSNETVATHTDVPNSSMFGSNIYNPNPTQQIGLRPIVIDGSNVAFGHSNGAYFSCKGLKFCIDFFLKRNHKVLAFVPKFRKYDKATKDPQILDVLEKQGVLSFTPSRRINGQLVVPYDDRYIVQYAAECGGIIISTDNYFDLLCENPTWKETIEKRLLMFTWAGDILIFPQDPLGRHGPSLEEFLIFP